VNAGVSRDAGIDVEAELREAAARMAEAQELARFGNWEWVVASDEVTWSDQLYRIFGLAPGQFAATFDAYLERIHPQDRDRVAARVRRALETREPYLAEHRIVLPDRSVRALRCHGQPVTDSAGKVVRLIGVCQDITELTVAEAGRRTAEVRFRNAFEHAPIGKALIDLDRGARMLEANRALSAITGFDQGRLQGMSLDALAAEEDRHLDREPRRRLLAGEIQSYMVEKRCRHKAGHLVWCQISVARLPSGESEGAHGIVQIQDISERRRFEDRLQYLADHDSLTGLLNRRRFRADLEQHVSRRKRYGGQGAVMVIDIDYFKRVNDTLGHHAGDNVIRRVADLLRKRARTSDTVARLSGDEFAVLMPRVDEAGAVQLAEDLRAEISSGARRIERGQPVTASFGIALYGGDERVSAETVLMAADLAMYRAKQEGRDRIAVAEDERGATVLHSQSIAARIRDALTKNRLTLYTQPIFDLATGETLRHELLLRMAINGGEPLPAAAFIEAAEKAGIVQDLDRWVVARALELMAERKSSGRPVSLHVNLSAASFTDLSVLEFIERRLDEGDADPKEITFEITETAAIRNFETAAIFADRLTEFGCQVAIDDYGAGFGPFYYLKHLPFDLIKIDGDFVRDLPSSDADQLTVQAIVKIARGLGKRTIAEFVQDDETTKMLREYGVDMAQGFHLGRPVALAEGLG
jgi:diguanylate cyclase (GGDEF)-like protein/PAS domain S-box-containing protein